MYVQFLQNCHIFKRISVSSSYDNFHQMCFITLFLITIRLTKKKEKKTINSLKGKFMFSIQISPRQCPLVLLVNEGCKHDIFFGILCFSYRTRLVWIIQYIATDVCVHSTGSKTTMNV